MRFIILLVLLSAFVFTGSTGYADPIVWGWGFGASSSFQDSGTVGAFGVKTLASDGYDPWDDMIVPGPRVYFGTYHQNGVDGWTGPTGFCSGDLRAPIPAVAGQSQTWVIYVWADPTLNSAASGMSLSWHGPLQPPSEYGFGLRLIAKPEGITDGPSVGMTYNLSQVPGQEITFPVFRTGNGLEGYVFEFSATAIPEPSSLLALGMGGLGMLGAALRRRVRARA